jgi:hypothetical protein
MEFHLAMTALSIALLGVLFYWHLAAQVAHPKGTKIPPGPPGKQFCQVQQSGLIEDKASS